MNPDGLTLAPNPMSSPIRLNSISEDKSASVGQNDTSRLTSYPASTYPASNEGDGAPPVRKVKKGSKPR